MYHTLLINREKFPEFSSLKKKGQKRDYFCIYNYYTVTHKIVLVQLLLYVLLLFSSSMGTSYAKT